MRSNSHMFPALSEHDVADGVDTYAVHSGDSGLCRKSAHGQDCPDLLVGQLCSMGSLSSRVAALGASVVNVVGKSAKEQMARPNAARDIALVQDAHFASRAVRKDPGNAMGHVDGLHSISSAPDGDLPVAATLADSCGPQPALAGLGNLRPKAEQESLVSQGFLNQSILLQHLRAFLRRMVSGVGSGANRYPFPVILAGVEA